MEDKKTKWHRPRLLILARGKKDEAVLQSCKYSSMCMGPDYIGDWMGCRNNTPPTYYCSVETS